MCDTRARAHTHTHTHCTCKNDQLLETVGGGGAASVQKQAARRLLPVAHCALGSYAPRRLLLGHIRLGTSYPSAAQPTAAGQTGQAGIIDRSLPPRARHSPGPDIRVLEDKQH